MTKNGKVEIRYILRDEKEKTWFDKYFTTILPASISFFGILLILVQIYNEQANLAYERSKDFSARYEENLSRLTQYLALHPPSADETFEWAETGLSDRQRIERMKKDLTEYYKLYGDPRTKLRFDDVAPNNPNPYSKSLPKSASLNEEIEYHRTKFLTLFYLVNSFLIL